MPLTNAQITAEIQTDPAALGLAALAAAAKDQQIADALNLVRAGAAYLVYRGVVSSYEIINATDAAEWAALTSGEKQRYQTLTGAGQVDVSNANVRAAFAAMFGAASISRPALLAMAQRQGSRAEVLGGPGTSVSAAQVGASR